ncbi:OR9A protein, partial [Acromyrmex insinuator]
MLVHVLREYNVNKILLSHLGLWPLQNKFVRRWLPISYLVIHISSLPFEILTLHDQLKNMRRVFENFYYIVCSILFIIKLSNEFMNHDKIRYLYKVMENHWNIFTDEFEMRILKNYSILSQKFTLIYAIALYIITIIYLMVPIKPILLDVILPLNESRPRFFMLSIEYKIDKDKYFVPLFCYNIIVVVTGVAILIGIDAIYVTRTIHACSLFSIISQQFEKIISQTGINMKVSKGGCYMNGMNALFKKSASEQLIYDEYIICLKKYQLALNQQFEKIMSKADIEVSENTEHVFYMNSMNILYKLANEQVIYEKYVICLKKYQFVLEFVDVLNSMYQIVALISLLFAVVIISLVGIKIIYIFDQFEELLKYIIVIIGSILQLMILCYPNQKLLDENQNVFYQIYAVEWYIFSPRLKSLLITTLHRSFIPCDLTAGNLFSISMATFAAGTNGHILLHNILITQKLKRIMLVNLLREYNVNRIFLSCLGLWPFQHKLARRLLPIFCFILEISYLPFEILTLYMHRYSGQIIFESLYQMVVTMAFLIKLLNQIWNRDKFRHLYEIMENHWNIFTNDLEVQILKSYSHVSQKFTVSYSILMYIMMSMFITIPSLGPMLLDVVLPLNKSRLRNIAIYSEYGIDQDKYFVPIFLYTSIMITVGITIMVAVDTMHIACTSHACSLFQFIGTIHFHKISWYCSQQIENVISNVPIGDEVNQIRHCTNTEYKMFSEEMIYRKYIICLKKHQIALEYVDILNDTHKIVGISFLLIIVAVFSLLGVRIVYVLDQLEELIRFTFIIMGALLQLMIVCYSGQKLMDESQNIFHRAYAAEWYKFSPRLKSLLIITLYRSIVSCKLTAGNLFSLSMAVFVSVVRTGVSYFTTLLSFKN